MVRFLTYLIVSIIFLSFISCDEIETYSEIPKIEYVDNEVSYEYEDGVVVRKKVELEFSILDGDGDVGLTETDTGAPYKDSLASNFFSEIYVRKNNKWISGKELNFVATSYRMPYMGEDYSAILKANVFIDFSYASKLFPYDSIKYTFYILDRALNKSNTDSTSVIVFTK